MARSKGRPRVLVEPCAYCNKQFKRREHLLRHERIHTRDKPFDCSCGHKFSRQDLLVRHRRLAHPSDSPQNGAAETTPAMSPSSVGAHAASPARPLSDGVDDGEMRSPAQDTDISLHTAAHMMQSLRDQVQDHDSVFVPAPAPAPTNVASSLLNNQQEMPQIFPNDSNGDSGVMAPLYDDILDQMHGNDFLDLFWADNTADSNFLPAVFCDTQYSLTHMTQRPDMFGLTAPDLAPNPPAESANLGAESQPLHTNAQGITSCEVVVDSSRSTTHNDISGLERGGLDSSADTHARAAWLVTIPMYAQMKDHLALLAHVLPSGFELPPRHTLSRYLEGYYRGFHEHLPFLHLPTMTPNALAPELLLGLAAVGAMYRFEHPKGYQLYFAAKALVVHQSSARTNGGMLSLLKSSPKYTGLASDPDGPGDADSAPHMDHTLEFTAPEQRAKLQTTQALIVLIALASWADKPVVGDALSMSSQLAMFVRGLGASLPDKSPEEPDWYTWVHLEERRRTLYTSFVLLGLQSVAFDVPPMLTARDLNLYLPSCGDEWKARNQAAWRACRSSALHESRLFQPVLAQLMSGKSIHTSSSVSAFGNYVLIHAIVQHICFERHISRYVVVPTPTLRADAIKTIETALQLWQASWGATSESSVDPLSSKGPMAFNSTALLRLAYMRLNADLGPFCKLDCRDAKCVVNAFIEFKDPIFTRSAHVERAVLQCIHALSIPVQAGVAFVARTQSTNWSIVHSLSTLECALLLDRWLETLAEVVETAGVSSFSEDERRLLALLSSLLHETDYSAALIAQQNDAMRLRRLAAVSIRVWAETLRGFHIFQIVHTIGEGLSIVADILEKRLSDRANDVPIEGS
ncbi:hypothetical protein Q7P37_010391 [Cladosporium fusiforme]